MMNASFISETRFERPVNYHCALQFPPQRGGPGCGKMLTKPTRHGSGRLDGLVNIDEADSSSVLLFNLVKNVTEKTN
jgi:hypothetical protein